MAFILLFWLLIYDPRLFEQKNDQKHMSLALFKNIDKSIALDDDSTNDFLVFEFEL